MKDENRYKDKKKTMITLILMNDIYILAIRLFTNIKNRIKGMNVVKSFNSLKC